MSGTMPETNRASVNSVPPRIRRLLLLAGFVLLLLWAAMWTVSLWKNRLVIGKYTAFPCWPYIGCDFDINYCAARTWIAGGDPYQSLLNGLPFRYDHPPLVLRLFSWTVLMPRPFAVVLWFSVQTAVFSLAVFACWRNRNELDLFRIPLPLILAAVLFSFPVVFEMERGNWNMLVLFFLLCTVAALRGRSLGCDVVAGSCAAIAAWIKIYPALFVLGLLALRRWRAAIFFGIVVLLIGLADVRGAREFAANIKESARQTTPDYEGGFISWSHTVSGSWRLVCKNLHLYGLGRLPGTAGWGLVVLPLILAVSYGVGKAPNPSRLLYPYFLWLIAAATYLPPIANDYSLFFLPLAALAVWDRRDPVFLHVLMAVLILWCLPIGTPISGKILFYSKLVSLFSVALVLLIRAGEQTQATPQGERVPIASPL